ncbi:moaA protein [Bifidobacterium vespertilionis]|uniref:MoaA protein n=1 Tax=Bifidobacterium vespertilionis TaxID=2562524 RepID=A0A5J5DUZ0_9BIFI|nr:moaA protein [Bifidobacterium vespertilionis]KAA8819608.1 moaA protein [Bifidobacterium vespertilionis]KAA8823384.1 moaA protein [Bifidobacterium vespertilionis]
MGKHNRIPAIIVSLLVAVLLAAGLSGALLWRSAQRVINEARQAGEYASQAKASYDRNDIKQALAQLDQAGDHIIAARDETQGPLWAAAEWVPYYGSDVAAVRGMLDAGADAASNALPKIDSAAQGTLIDFSLTDLLSGASLSNGTLSIPKIASVKQDMADAGAVLSRVRTSIHALPQPHTRQIADLVEQGRQAADQVDESFNQLNAIIARIPG